MPKWLPWALLAVAVLLLAAMPWRRPHPNHEFMLRQWSRLSEDTHEQPPPTSGSKEINRATLAAASRPDRTGSAHV